MANVFRKIPSVTELLEAPAIQGLVDRVHHSTIVTNIRSLLDDLREDVRDAASEMAIPTPAELAEQIAAKILKEDTPKLRRVVNATGILLHTGLGRAPLAAEALLAIQDVCGGYASVELDLKSGERSQRVESVAPMLCRLTGAEAAIVVNNNAAATVLALAGIAANKEVIVSRGQLVEIGGSFRLPDVMEQSGAVMREVGTTNKSRISDYENAIGDATGALLRVHTSNFRVVGFTAQVGLSDLIALGKRYKVPVIDDVGSGALMNLKKYGFDEPQVPKSVAAGADVVLFSGDKLIGGPQCGILVGKRAWIDRLARHPLMRAFRVDKLTLAALAATLKILTGPEEVAEQKIPLLALLATSAENLKNRAERLATQLTSCRKVATAEAVPSTAYLGGGSVPTEGIASWSVAVEPQGVSLNPLAQQLREGIPAIVGRVQNDRFHIDLRTMTPAEDRLVAEAIAALGQ